MQRPRPPSKRPSRRTSDPLELDACPGRVVARKGPVMFVELDGERRACMARGRGKGAVVGDRVTVEGDLVTSFGIRKSELVRVDALGDRPQVIAANVDVMFIVCAVEPPLREGLIDRYIVAAHAARIAPVILFNKTDLWLDDDPEDEEDFRDRLSPYPPIGVPVHYTSATEDRGLDAVREEMKGRLGIFVGHSGVGKTSLLNALCPGLANRTQELSEQSGRGRHTTTHTELFTLPDGGEVIDSPGIRAFGLWAMAPEQVKDHFVEFAAYAGQCKFANCIHDHEPGCAVKAAVEAEVINPFRYEAYLRIKESLADDRP